MSAQNQVQAVRLPADDRRPADSRGKLSAAQRRQIVVITTVALAVFLFFRWLPTGTALSHMDFRVDAKNAIEFCDPSNPQFIPVVAVASPIAMEVKSSATAHAGEPVNAVAILRTASGKPVAPEDLLVVHTERLHLLIADPELKDYQHVHPQPSGAPGEWRFAFTPRASGIYRVFADFTPAATNRGLYSSADLTVASPRAAKGQANIEATGKAESGAEDYRFSLQPQAAAWRAGEPMDLRFEVTRAGGGPVQLEPVMDAYAHLVAFDETRSGFAHLHPMETDLSRPPDTNRPTLNFKITIPAAGRYVVWAQVKIDGRERFVPFWFEVTG